MLEQVVADRDGHQRRRSRATRWPGRPGRRRSRPRARTPTSPGAYMASFVGFAPAVNPTLSMIVVLDRPTPIFGGTVAAPVFSQIMSYALHRYDIPTTPGRRHHEHLRRDGRDQRPGAGHHVSRYHQRAHGGGDGRLPVHAPLSRAIMRTVQMNLLFDDIEVIETAGDPVAVDVTGIAHDSRRVVPGDLFCCVPGSRQRRARLRRPRRWTAGRSACCVSTSSPSCWTATGRADPHCARDHAPGHGPAGRRLLRLSRPATS